MILLLNIVLLTGLAWVLCRPFYQKFGPVAIWGLLAKALGAFSMGLIYHWYYTDGDTWLLWQQISAFNESATTGISGYLEALFSPINPYQENPRSIFFVRLMSPLGLISQNAYMALSGYLCLFSYWSSWSFASVIQRHYPKVRSLALVVFCFLPTYLFWASGLLKDTLINGCLLYLSAALVMFYHTKKLKPAQWILTLVLFWCLLMTRHFVAGVWSILAILLTLHQWVGRYGARVRWLVITSVLVVGAYSIRFFFIRLRPERFPITFHELYEQIVAKSAAGSIILFDLQPTWPSFLSNLPKSLWTGLFRPGLWEAGSVLQVLEAIQTTFFFACFGCTLVLIRKLQKIPMTVVMVMIFVVALATLLPLATPNFGSLSRYRVSFTPFLGFLLMYLPYRQFVKKDL